MSIEDGTQDLARILSETATSAAVTLRPGTFVKEWSSNRWLVFSGGVPVEATWNPDLIPEDGGKCLLLLASEDNKSQYFVICRLGPSSSPGPTARVSAFTGGQPTLTIEADDGTSYTAIRASGYTPVVNDRAILTYGRGNIYAVGAQAVYTPPYVPPAEVPIVAPPPPPARGTSNIPCQDSATWTYSYGKWNDYYKQNVYTGSGYAPSCSGSWWYNGGTWGLGDKPNITRIQFWLPPRRAAGGHATANLPIYAHDQAYRGSAEPARVAGPHNVAVPYGWGGGWIDLPLSFAGPLKGGGGISIAGDPYQGYTGVAEHGNSGALSVDWSY
jgi:hypothetical protein